MDIIANIESIVREAAKIMLDREFDVTQKGNASNIVTSADIKVQKFLEKELLKIYPGSIFLGEEGDNNIDKGDAIWIVDPIDGTSNFMRNLKLSAISVGLLEQGELTVGVVYLPYIDEMFTARKGEGAFLNGKPIHVSDRDFAHSHLCSAMSLYDKNFAKPCFNIIERVYSEADDLRRMGSAALEMCELAAGRVELYFEVRLCSWDCAATAVIIREAGGFVEFMFHDNIVLNKPMGVIAANSKENFEHLREIVYGEIPKELY